MSNVSRKKMRDIREIVMAVAQTKSEARSLAKALKEGLTQTFDEIHAGPINPEYFYPLGSNAECSSQHSKKLYKLTRQLTHIKNRLETHPDNQTYSKLLLDSVEEVIGLITSYREETRELPFDWIKQRFLIEDHRGKKLIYPPGNHSQLMAIRPKLVYYESDDECDTCDTVEGSLKDPNFSGLGRLDLVISNPLVDHGTKALAVSYLSCLESICKTFEDLSKEKDKRLTDIYMGVGVPEVYTAGGEMQQHKEIAALTKNGLRSRLEEDRQRYLQSYSIQTTNSGNSSKAHKLSIPQIVGTVWEACSALKKTPGTNVTAIGRAMTQIAVSIKDVHREMKELKPTSEEAAKPDNEVSKPDHDSDNSSEGDLGSDLSPEEMKIAELATEVVSCTLETIKEVIRSISGLLKNPQTQNESNETVDSLEKLLTVCQSMGLQVDEIGACLYPPQEVSAIRTASEKMVSLVGEMQAELEKIKGSSDAFSHSSKGLISSLKHLESELGCSSDDELVSEMENLAVDT